MISHAVLEESQVGAARRSAIHLAEAIGLDADALDRLAIVVTEAATNLVRHAVNGELLVDARSIKGKAVVKIIAIDDGPGIANVEAAMVDGYSTSGGESRGIGGGLGSMTRQADHLDIHSSPQGTTLVATIGDPLERPSRGYDIFGLVVPKPGFESGGDAFAVKPGRTSTMVMLMDVLGHGPTAATDAGIGVDAFRNSKSASLDETEALVSEALTGSRGAAALIVDIPHRAGTLRAVGLGNVRGEIIASSGARHGIPSHPGILGATTRRPRPTEHEWSDDTVLVLSTDGLKSTQKIPEPNALFFKSAQIIAASLYKLRRRGTDDAGIVVVRSHS